MEMPTTTTTIMFLTTKDLQSIRILVIKSTVLFLTTKDLQSILIIKITVLFLTTKDLQSILIIKTTVLFLLKGLYSLRILIIQTQSSKIPQLGLTILLMTL